MLKGKLIWTYAPFVSFLLHILMSMNRHILVGFLMKPQYRV